MAFTGRRFSLYYLRFQRPTTHWGNLIAPLRNKSWLLENLNSIKVNKHNLNGIDY